MHITRLNTLTQVATTIVVTNNKVTVLEAESTDSLPTKDLPSLKQKVLPLKQTYTPKLNRKSKRW